MFIRTKTIHGSKYAYLVESVWNKGRTIQRSKKYLGKVVSVTAKTQISVERLLEGIKTDEPFLSHSQKQLLMEHILGCLLHDIGFREAGKLFRLEVCTDSEKGYIVLVGKKVEFAHKKPACLELNEGFLCTSTLNAFRRIVSNFPNASHKAQFLAEGLLSCGICLEKEAFIELFHILADTD